jgi:hypothetical protein
MFDFRILRNLVSQNLILEKLRTLAPQKLSNFFIFVSNNY